jgi:hypothetical protein
VSSTSGDEWDTDADVVDIGSRQSTRQQDGQGAPEPYFDSLEQWVTEYFVEMIRRPQPKGFRWCPQWWRHPEVHVRLEALWRSWEALRLDGTTGMSVWFRDHLDPHFRMLTDSDLSPMSKCSTAGHVEENPQLPVDPAPPGWWGGEGTPRAEAVRDENGTSS